MHLAREHKKLHPPVLCTWQYKLICVLSILSKSHRSDLLGCHHQRRLYPNSSCFWPWARPHTCRSRAFCPTFLISSIKLASESFQNSLLLAAYAHSAFSYHHSFLTDTICFNTSTLKKNELFWSRTVRCNVTWGKIHCWKLFRVTEFPYIFRSRSCLRFVSLFNQD